MANLTFEISSALLLKENQKVLVPDKDGIYRRIPLMVIGKVSRNHKDYEPKSMIAAISDKNALFRKKLGAGCLIGEYRHPLIWKEEEYGRVYIVDSTLESHTIHSVYMEQPTERGHSIVYGDIECSGPYGSYLKERFENPRKNAAFSLRSVCKPIGKRPDGTIVQTVTTLVTIDAVDCGGYAEAMKVHVPSCEGLSIPIDPIQALPNLAPLLGFEDIQDQQLLDILEVDKVTVANSLRGYYDRDKGVLRTEEGKHSVFHEVFSRRAL